MFKSGWRPNCERTTGIGNNSLLGPDQVLKRRNVGQPTYEQRRVLVEVLCVRLGSMLKEEVGVFYQTLLYSQEERSLTTKGPNVH